MSVSLLSMARRRMITMSEYVKVFKGKEIRKRFALDRAGGDIPGYDARGQTQEILLHQFDSVAE